MNTSNAVDGAGALRAVVFDLFGTLVNARSHQDQTQAAEDLAAAFDVTADQVHPALADSWPDRHLGRWESGPQNHRQPL
jgi:FMN phosphatase YigB (HAD superfamily)